MSTQLITPSPAPVRHHHLRTAAIAAGVTAVIAAGGYVATTTFGPDSVPVTPVTPTSPTVNPSDQVLRALRESIAGQYGSQATPARGATVNPSADVRRALSESIAGQYGGAR
jgi:hypothetical protein